MERKGYESIGCYAYFVTKSYDLDVGFQGQILKLLYLRNGGPIDTERKRCESIGC